MPSPVKARAMELIADVPVLTPQRISREPETQNHCLSRGEVTNGDVYLWENLAAARAFYSGPWLNGIIERYNAYPKITYFDTMAMTDNTTNEIKIFDEQKNK